MAANPIITVNASIIFDSREVDREIYWLVSILRELVPSSPMESDSVVTYLAEPYISFSLVNFGAISIERIHLFESAVGLAFSGEVFSPELLDYGIWISKKEVVSSGRTRLDLLGYSSSGDFFDGPVWFGVDAVIH